MKIDRRSPRHWLYLALFAANVLAALLLRPLRRRGPRRRIVLYGHKLNGNLLALYRRLASVPDYEVAFLTLDPAYARALAAQGANHQLATTPGCARWLATAAAVISDHGLHALGLMLGRSDLKFIDVWHGIPFKGFDADDFRVQHRYDEVWVASPLLRKLYTGRFGFDPARVHTTGYARTDRLVKPAADRSALRRQFGLGDGPVVLFAPTWQQDARGRSIYPFGLDAGAFLDALARTCRPHGATVVVRAHLNSALTAPARESAVYLPHAQFPDTEALLLASDVLVCDWSSIAFDYLLLDRPTLFLDVPAPFRKGFSLGPEHRFGPVVSDLEALRQRLDQALGQPAAYRAEFGARHQAERAAIYGDFADGRAAERGAERLAQLLGDSA
jgi:CDP-glycerol glycerophosphotransferase (TagB/SpsB family)